MSRISLKLRRQELDLLLEALETAIALCETAGQKFAVADFIELEDMLRGHLRSHDLAEANHAA